MAIHLFAQRDHEKDRAIEARVMKSAMESMFSYADGLCANKLYSKAGDDNNNINLRGAVRH